MFQINTGEKLTNPATTPGSIPESIAPLIRCEILLSSRRDEPNKHARIIPGTSSTAVYLNSAATPSTKPHPVHHNTRCLADRSPYNASYAHQIAINQSAL